MSSIAAALGTLVTLETGKIKAEGDGEPVDDVGDDAAFASAYERWAGQVHGMAVRAFGSGPDAEDVAVNDPLPAGVHWVLDSADTGWSLSGDGANVQ